MNITLDTHEFSFIHINFITIYEKCTNYNYCKLCITSKNTYLHFYNNDKYEISRSYKFCLPIDITNDEIKELSKYNSIFKNISLMQDNYNNCDGDKIEEIIYELQKSITRVLQIIDEIFGYGLSLRGCSSNWESNFEKNTESPEIIPLFEDESDYEVSPRMCPRP